MLNGTAIGFLIWAAFMLWFMFYVKAGISLRSSIMLAVVVVGSGAALGFLLP